MDMLYEKNTKLAIDDVGARLELAAQNHKFGVLNVIDLKAKMASKGVAFGPECRIYEVCNPHRAKEVLERNPSISTALPCRIALYQAGDCVKLSTLLPTKVLGLFGTPELAQVAQVVECKVKPSVPYGEVSVDAFGEKQTFEDKGNISRAILDIGRQDLFLAGTFPHEPVEILGASSDYLTVDCSGLTLSPGDELTFDVDYGGMLAVMTSNYVEKVFLN